MKVLDLQCVHAHHFEGWFASEDDFQDQLARGLVSCPMCGSDAVTKKLSAPRLNLHTPRGDAAAANHPGQAHELDHAPAQPVSSSTTELTSPLPQAVASMSPTQLQAAWLQMTRHVLANTEDVGDRFAEEVRRMHHGEQAHRNIRGQASTEQTQALLEEGIAVMPLVIPEALKGPVQ